ncbi:MAG: AAA family ATPase, partial [Pirellulaceae bacterium]
DASAGLTRYEAEGAYSLSLVREGQLSAETVWKLKSGMLKKSGLLGLHRSGEDFSKLGGLEGLKAFCRRATMRSSSQASESEGGRPNVRARGVMLLGTAGVGKSAFAKALGAETGRPTLTLDIGALMGSLVGQTETNIRKALQIADAMAPSILFVDEVEKALSGAAGGAQDSGVSSRLFGTLLTWMNDHTSDVFLVATCNDISKLPPEFVRAERFDGVFFLDLPNEEQREQIWNIHLQGFGLDPEQRRPDDSQWTGAEIRSCCRLAALLDLSLVDAAQNVVPIAVTASETVERLRNWASGRCLSADRAGIYRHQSEPKNRRRVSRSPSAN